MSTAATTPDCIDDDAALAAVAALAAELIELLYGRRATVGTALDALLHAYVAIVRAHPHLTELSERSLLSAVRGLAAGASHDLH